VDIENKYKDIFL